MVVVVNKTKNIRLKGKIKLCGTFLSRIKGLMFEKRKIGAILIFNRPTYGLSIHTWFCKYPLDIYFINERNKVVKIFKNVKPWSFIFCNKKTKWVLELSSNIWNIEKGDELSYE